jgi:stress response protein YsnF
MSKHPANPDSTIPIMEEAVHIERAEVTTGAVRVRVRADTRTELVDEPVLSRGVEVERVPRGVFVEDRRESWMEGEVLVVPVYREVVVKRTLLVEEIRMTPTVSVQQERQHFELASETALFERQNPDGTWKEVSLAELHAPSAQ